MDPSSLADRLASQPGECLELVLRLGLVAAMPPTAATAVTVAQWAAAVLATLATLPDPVVVPPPPPVAPPAPPPPTGRPVVVLYPEPVEPLHYVYYRVDQASVPLARATGLLLETDGWSVADAEVVFRSRRALDLGADVLLTATPAGAT